MKNHHHLMKKLLKGLVSGIQRENLLTLFVFIIFIVLISSLAITYFEPDVSFVSGIWWSVVTLTTVGYGDISPSSMGGRVVAAIIMFFGIGLLGMLSANLATIMISNRIRENKGMGTTDLVNHIILCEWNHRSRSVLKEMRADQKTAKTPVVLIADLAEKPIDDHLLFFISGPANEETLEKANLKEAATVVVLGDDSIDPTSRDAKVVLTTLTIETCNPNAYTVVEIVDEVNKQHCRRANADEIIVGSELSSHLLATAAISHGMSNIVSELISSRYGNDLFSVEAPKKYIGGSFMDILLGMKEEYKATVLGVQKGRGGELIANPDGDYQLTEGDQLVLIARERPVV
jgi:voltage-gated potassium channel